MSVEENKEKVRRFLEEGYGEGKTELVDELLDPDFVCHDPTSETGGFRGAQIVKEEIEYFRQAAPDLTFIIEDQIAAEGNKVVTRWRATGTHQGEFFGISGTGKPIELNAMLIDRFDEGGKLVEEWISYDLLKPMRQIGAIPEPEQAQEAS